MKRLEVYLICDCVETAWSQIKEETGVKSFKKCSISNNSDSTEDNFLWVDDDETVGDVECDPKNDEETVQET